MHYIKVILMHVGLFKWSSESEVKKCKNDVDKREKIKEFAKGKNRVGVHIR